MHRHKFIILSIVIINLIYLLKLYSKIITIGSSYQPHITMELVLIGPQFSPQFLSYHPHITLIILISASYNHGACLNRSPMHHLSISSHPSHPLSPSTQYQCFQWSSSLSPHNINAFNIHKDHHYHHGKHHYRHHPDDPKHQNLSKSFTKLQRFARSVISLLLVSASKSLSCSRENPFFLLASPLHREQRCNPPSSAIPDPTKAQIAPHSWKLLGPCGHSPGFFGPHWRQ